MTYSKESFGSRNEDKIDGLDVVSPTWFEVSDVKGIWSTGQVRDMLNGRIRTDTRFGRL
jgi:hypothetical protein